MDECYSTRSQGVGGDSINVKKLHLGLDIGGSTTKVVAIEGKQILGTCLVSASDPLTAAYGALGRFLKEQNVPLEAVGSLHSTGVGLSHLGEDLHGIPIQRIDEFVALARGARFLSGEKDCLAVSVGTGTAFVSAKGNTAKHIIGSGVGGGTLLGLSHAILETRDWEQIDELALAGNSSEVDLTIRDLTNDEIPGLTSETTASNFGRLSDASRREDLAAAIVTMVYQTVGIIAVTAARAEGLESIVCTGNGVLLKSAGLVLKAVSELYNLPLYIPEHTEYATAIGAALVSF